MGPCDHGGRGRRSLRGRGSHLVRSDSPADRRRSGRWKYIFQTSFQDGIFLPMVLRCLRSVSGWLLGAWVSFSSLCSHGSGGSHGAGDVRVGGQAQNTPTAALFSVGIGTSTPTSTYTRRFNTISRIHCLKNYSISI